MIERFEPILIYIYIYIYIYILEKLEFGNNSNDPFDRVTKQILFDNTKVFK